MARIYRRRRSNREARTHEAHPWIGGLMLAFNGGPQHESSWRQGEVGEKTVAAYLERRTKRRPAIILYDRAMPGTRANVDLLAVAPTGVYVIDAKATRGDVRVSRPLFGAPKLLVAGRNRAKYLDGLDRQILAVRRALAGAGQGDVEVSGVLCFTEAKLPWLGVGRLGGHRLLGRSGLARRLNRKGALTPEAIDALARALSAALPAA